MCTKFVSDENETKIKRNKEDVDQKVKQAKTPSHLRAYMAEVQKQKSLHLGKNQHFHIAHIIFLREACPTAPDATHVLVVLLDYMFLRIRA